MARVYADINAQMPRAYWDYDSVNISWGILENYEVVRKIGTNRLNRRIPDASILTFTQAEANTRKYLKASISSTIRNVLSKYSSRSRRRR